MKAIFRWPLLLLLRRQARRALEQHRPLIIGVAGAVGKSSTVQALYAALQGSRRVRYTPGNSETGVPLGILNIKQTGYGFFDWVRITGRALFPHPDLESIEILIIEMGTDELTAPKNMSYLLSIVDPDIALWLNVYPTHLSQFALGLSARERAIPEREKADLIVRKMAEEDGKIITASHGHTALYCLDNQPIVDELARHAVTLGTKKVQTFGTHPNATISYGPYSVTTTGTVFEFTLDKKNLSLTLPGFVVPEAYREVCAAAILTARAVGVEPDSAIRNLMNNFTLPPGRSTVLQGINGSTIIDSTYNASPEAMRTFLHLLTTLDPTHARPRVFLCGDMRELGEHSAREHEALATLLPGIADYVYGVGTETKQHIITYLERTHASTSFKEVRWFPTAIALGEYLQRTLPNHALILAKGSQNTIFMEEALNIILRTQEDRARLCRQEPYWQTMKKNFFATKTGA